MENVKVKAKVTGLHAVSGTDLVMGEEYLIDRAHFGHQVMEPVDWTPTDDEMGIKSKVSEPANETMQEVDNTKEAAYKAAAEED
jgi:hypothetical protein